MVTEKISRSDARRLATLAAQPLMTFQIGPWIDLVNAGLVNAHLGIMGIRLDITPAGRAWLAANKEKQDE